MHETIQNRASLRWQKEKIEKKTKLNRLIVLKNDFMELTKFKLSTFTVGTAIVGLILALNSVPDFSLFINACIGIYLAAFASSIFNQVIEIKSDALMPRTENRPLPAGRIKKLHALILALAFSAISITFLAFKINILCAALTLLTIFIYIFFYTPLKKISPINTEIGAIAGALPPLAGWTAAGSQSISRPAAIYIFLLLFFWQLYHFYSLCWLYKDQYKKAGFKMLCHNDPSGCRTSRRIIFSIIMLLLLNLMPLFFDFGKFATWKFSLIMNIITLFPVYLALKFKKNANNTNARNIFLSSIFYLPLCLILILLL